MNDISEEYSDARVSRTARYRKVTKPLLERRRRARINRCLEELKDLMVGALEVERENINKLEKADILELTVRHLSKLKGPKDIKAEAERFQAGFGCCAAEAYHFILSTPGVDQTIIQQLVKHLSTQINDKPTNHIQPPEASPAPSSSSLSSGHISPHSPSYPLDYQQTSPASSHEDERIRYQHTIKETTPSIPIEKSLTCDVSSYNTHAVVRRPGEPTTGLLMTVNDLRRMSSYVPDYQAQQTSTEVTNYKRGSMDVREQPAVDPNAERKNNILRKIREHIMERQHREPDSTTSSKSEPQIPNPRETMKRYRLSSEEKPRFSEQLDISPEQHKPISYAINRSANVSICDNKSEEAVNLSGNKHETINNNKEDSSYVTSSQATTGTKRQYTDYKNIHPKKLLIRAPNLSNENSQENKEDHIVDRNDALGGVTDGGQGSNHGRGNIFKEGFQRYKGHFFNLEREEYYRDPNMEHDDMWRPW